MKARCFACGEPAIATLGIRCRVQGGNAIWAPELGGAVCGLHARGGMDVEIDIKTNLTGRVRTTLRHDGVTVSKSNYSIGGGKAEALF